MHSTVNFPGYTFGSPTLPAAPLTLEDVENIKQVLLFTEDDRVALNHSKEILRQHCEEILDVCGFVGSHPVLLASFFHGKDQKPNSDYLAAVRKRFAQWIVDTASADYDQQWVNYQYEIGHRHYRTGKNRTDQVQATEVVPFRYLIPLAYPIVATLKPFLEKTGAPPKEIEAMQQAWRKSVLLQVTLWSYPYIKEGDY